MRKKLALLASLIALPVIGCAYGDVVAHPNGKLYVARNDGFLFGALRKMYECTPDGAGGVNFVAVSGRP
jgi:hypothetical protein